MGLINAEKILERDLEDFNEYLEANKNRARNAMKTAEVTLAYLGRNETETGKNIGVETAEWQEARIAYQKFVKIRFFILF